MKSMQLTRNVIKIKNLLNNLPNGWEIRFKVNNEYTKFELP